MSAGEHRKQHTAPTPDPPADLSVVRPRRAFLLRVGAAVVGTVLAGASGEATRPFGLLRAEGLRMRLAASSRSSGVSRSGLGRGIVTRGAHMEVKQGADVVIDSVAISPGGTTGWHTHPGAELVLVTKGTLKFRRSDGLACITEEEVSAGQATVGAAAGELHEAHNGGSESVELVVTFFNVPSGAPPRADADPPVACP